MRAQRYANRMVGMLETDSGQYVRYEDYAAIARKCHAQRRELRSLHKKWATVRWAMKRTSPRVEIALDPKGLPLLKDSTGRRVPHVVEVER